VSEETIKKIIVRHPEATLQDVINKTGASTSCGRCRTELEAVFQKLTENSSDKNKSAQLTLPFDFPGN
jgi:bacterioferritin-associated ferredoxin